MRNYALKLIYKNGKICSTRKTITDPFVQTMMAAGYVQKLQGFAELYRGVFAVE